MDVIEGNAPYFDEQVMFADHNLELKSEFKNRFRNISKIMDCVGCEKCRLWGKLQVSGIGTALKILFSYDTAASLKSLKLKRGELVSLFNAFGRVSESVDAVEYFRGVHLERQSGSLEATKSSGPSSPTTQTTEVEKGSKSALLTMLRPYIPRAIYKALNESHLVVEAWMLQYTGPTTAYKAAEMYVAFISSLTVVLIVHRLFHWRAKWRALQALRSERVNPAKEN
jgi:hypothetical protein